jgi:hypothetical protein
LTWLTTAAPYGVSNGSASPGGTTPLSTPRLRVAPPP